MRLPDFRHDAKFTRLRRAMGARETRDIGGVNWEPLGRAGIEVHDITEVVPTTEGTLSWNGRTVLLYIRDQPVSFSRQREPKSGYKYHLAECSTVVGMRSSGRGDRYMVTNRRDGLFVVRSQHHWTSDEEYEVELQPCLNCLRLIDWDGAGSDWSAPGEAVRASFDLDEFFEIFDRVVPAHRRFPGSTGSLSKSEPRRAPPAARQRVQTTKEVPARSPTRAPPPVRRTVPPTSWLDQVPEPLFRRALQHLEEHETLTESEFRGLAGSESNSRASRKFRRFKNAIDDYLAAAPFTVSVRSEKGQTAFRVRWKPGKRPKTKKRKPRPPAPPRSAAPAPARKRTESPPAPPPQPTSGKSRRRAARKVDLVGVCAAVLPRQAAEVYFRTLEVETAFPDDMAASTGKAAVRLIQAMRSSRNFRQEDDGSWRYLGRT